MKKVLIKLLGVVFLICAALSVFVFIKSIYGACLAIIQIEGLAILGNAALMLISMICTSVFGMFGYIIFNEA